MEPKGCRNSCGGGIIGGMRADECIFVRETLFDHQGRAGKRCEAGRTDSNHRWRPVKKLREGLFLQMRHPRTAEMDCGYCQVHVVDDSWRPVLLRDGRPEKRNLNAGPEFLPACRDLKRGCPKGSPEHPKTLSEDNQLCFQHYRECAAVGVFPDDSVVRRNAAAICEVIESVERSREVELQSSLLKLTMENARHD